MVEKLARFLLGCILLMVGFNYFLNFLPYPEMTVEAGQFMKALDETQYMFPMIKCLELVAAVLFLLNCFVPLATLLILPGIVNIFLFHLFLDQGGLVMGVFLMGLLGIIMAHHKDAYASLFRL